MQNFVHQVFVVVSSVIATLLTIGLTGVIVLIATDDHTPHSRPATPA